MAQSWTNDDLKFDDETVKSNDAALDLSQTSDSSQGTTEMYKPKVSDSNWSFLASSSVATSSVKRPSSPSPSHSPSISRRSSNSSTESPGARSHTTTMEEMGTSGLWVFGYGSLCWHQGFEFSESMTGYVVGFSRRFWQGNVTHRGTQSKPGRVATLIEENEGIVWGEAFRVRGEAALPYLNNRECELGGYRTTLTTFHPRDRSVPPFPAVLYVATPNNCHWLGEKPLSSIADEIVDCKGASGHNVEYLLRLADFVRERVPEAQDDHLFGLESLVRDRVKAKQLCLSTLMGEERARGEAVAAAAVAVEPAPQPAAPSPSSSSQFSNRVPTKKLRCVNI